MANAKLIYVELRPQLLRAGVVLGGLLILMIVAGVFNSQMYQARESAKQSLQGLTQDYRTAIGSEQILRTETSRFLQLQAKGIVGPEPRLRWVEDVRDIAARAGLVSISYELEPRVPAAINMNTGGYQLFTSLMRLKLELRHEGDLFRFMDMLEARGGGLFDLSACGLVRSHDDVGIRLQESNVLVNCELLWYSLDSANSVVAGVPQ